jgi:hypothetical protein
MAFFQSHKHGCDIHLSSKQPMHHGCIAHMQQCFQPGDPVEATSTGMLAQLLKIHVALAPRRIAERTNMQVYATAVKHMHEVEVQIRQNPFLSEHIKTPVTSYYGETPFTLHVHERRQPR